MTTFALPKILLSAAATVALTAVGLSVPAAASAVECAPGANAIVCENAQTGTDPDEWEIWNSGDGSIQGFSTDISVNVGGSISFKIDTDADDYSIEIFRTGWYQGLGARRIDTISPAATLPQVQPQCLSDLTTELYDCGTWGVSATWQVPATSVSGVYFALLTRADTGGRSHITFVVRNDSSQSDILFQTSDPTWQAYNPYGGSDFYQGGDNGRAYKVSYNRPIMTRGENNGRDFYFGSEYPLVRFLEKNGYDVSYFSGVDTDRRGQELLEHNVFLSVGHDEYWSAAQRAHVEAARDAGVNLQFLSGNDDYWRTRYEASSVGSVAYRTLVTYKETWANEKIDPSTQWTGTWRDPRFASPANGGGVRENALSGTAYMANFSDLPITVSAEEGDLRLWRNTSLTSLATGTSAALAAHTVGYESNEDVDNGARPPGLVHLSTTVGAVPEYLQDFGSVVLPGTTTHNVTLYRAASGALVFSAGSVQWTWGLDQTHDGSGAAADVRMQQAQINLLADMGVQPTSLVSGLVAATASTDHTAPTVTVSAPTASTATTGTSSMTVTGTASDSGGRVAGVEVSTDGGTTWHAATGRSTWSYSYAQHGMGPATVRVRAIDDSGNYPSTPTTVTLAVGSPYSVFGADEPTEPDSGDPSSVTLGLRFTPTVDGFVKGVRFFKSASNTGTHTGTLWSSSGVQLAAVAFTTETTDGWQSAQFSVPVPVTAGQTYVVSYTTISGHYSAASWFWAYTGSTAPPLTVAGGFGASPAGVYSTNGGYPTSAHQMGNYYVDALFDTVDDSPIVLTDRWPVAGSSSIPTSTAISAVLSKAVVASSVTATLTGPAAASVAGTVSYAPSTRTVTFTPTSSLAINTSYTVSVTATTATGASVGSTGSWGFTTVEPTRAVGDCPCSIHPPDVTPTILQISDGVPVALGVRFATTVAGTVTGIRFYKGPGNTGTHTGRLYSASGTLLASAVFGSETTTGWQTVTFSSPIAVSAGADYVAAYTTTGGTYSATPSGYGSGYTRGPLVVAADSGAYSYSGDSPTAASTSSYLVDVVFND